jgi:enoyl-[acyl-carrier-protein] reductase (NADH)
MALKGKFGLVCGVVNSRSIAWAVAQSWRAAGCDVSLTYQDERARPKVERLVAAEWGDEAAAGCAAASSMRSLPAA